MEQDLPGGESSRQGAGTNGGSREAALGRRGQRSVRRALFLRWGPAWLCATTLDKGGRKCRHLRIGLKVLDLAPIIQAAR